MSHFAVLVIGNEPDAQIAKYDENLELPMHQVATREELIAKKRAWIEDYKNGLYAEYLADPEKYIESCKDNAGHIDYITRKFPKMLEWTDDECYEDEIEDYREYIKDGETWCEIHEDGSLWETTNENARWDWYQIGGRYRGLLKLKEGAEPVIPLHVDKFYESAIFGGAGFDYRKATDEMLAENRCDQAYRRDVINLDDVTPYVVVKDGEWYERGKMGWWAIASNEKEEDVWESEVRKLLQDIPGDELLTVFDCHI